MVVGSLADLPNCILYDEVLERCSLLESELHRVPVSSALAQVGNEGSTEVVGNMGACNEAVSIGFELEVEHPLLDSGGGLCAPWSRCSSQRRTRAHRGSSSPPCSTPMPGLQV